MKKLILAIVLLGVSLKGNPNSKNSFEIVKEIKLTRKSPLLEIMQVIKFMESKNNPNARSPRGKYLGVLQIGQVCINEVNRHYGTTYKHRDAFSVACSEDIFLKAINLGIESFKRKYNKKPSEEQIVRMWNGGIYTGYKSPKTKKYYTKYLRHKEKVL